MQGLEKANRRVVDFPQGKNTDVIGFSCNQQLNRGKCRRVLIEGGEMASTHKGLRAKQRENVKHAYNARGHQNNNLWLIYSVKTNRDWILPSDRQLVHWLHYLETNKDVRTFDLAPEAVVGNDGHKERVTEIDALVTCTDGTIEWHEVKADPADSTSQITAQRDAASRAGHIHRLFTDKELKPHVKTAMRWFKAICFAAAIRNHECNPARLALLAYVNWKRRGFINDILADLNSHEPPIIYGVLVRLTIEGLIDLDLTVTSFGPRTPWAVAARGS
jgi:hypothetical protein